MFRKRLTTSLSGSGRAVARLPFSNGTVAVEDIDRDTLRVTVMPYADEPVLRRKVSKRGADLLTLMLALAGG